MKVKKVKKRLTNWFLKGSTNEFMFLKRKQVKEYQQKKYEII